MPKRGCVTVSDMSLLSVAHDGGGCIALPLSEKVQPPMLTNTFKLGLMLLRSAVSVKVSALVAVSIVVISNVLGSIL